MESKQLDKDLHKVTESTRWTSRTSYYGPEFEICWPKNCNVWFLLDFSFLTNDLTFMNLWKAIETTSFKIKVAQVVHLFLRKVVTVITCQLLYKFHNIFVLVSGSFLIC